MAEGFWHSKREVKVRSDNDFVYEKEDLRFLSVRNKSISETRQQCTGENLELKSGTDEITTIHNFVDNTPNNWSSLLNFPRIHSQIPISVNRNNSNNSVESLGIPSRSQNRVDSPAENVNSEFVYDSGSDNSGAHGRCNSSTNFNFLDSGNYYNTVFLSESSTAYSERSDMASGDEASSKCGCEKGQSCANCIKSSNELAGALMEALGKFNLLTDEIKGMKESIEGQSKRLQKLESDSASEHRSNSERDEDSQRSSASTNRGARKKASKASSSRKKTDRVEEEKVRSLKVVQDNFKDRRTDKESGSGVESSDQEVELGSLRKSMSRRKKKDCDKKVMRHLKQVGAAFPEDSDTTATSGTESEYRSKRCRHKRQVKSGAEVKKRPVVRTELWPHTISNEEEGEDITSDSIGLAIFFSCFTLIMMECGKREAEGRTALLHAVSRVLECLPWADARSFHNLVMVKMEQGKYSWSMDFTELAEDFMDRKVRQSLRGKGPVSGASNAYKSYNSRSFGKASGSFSNRGNYQGSFQSNNFQSRSKSLYAMVCRQWNFGSCYYNDRCKKWHYCWTCAEAGKPGESHKASTHDPSGARSKPSANDQRG